jgi:hypothetical protein
MWFMPKLLAVLTASEAEAHERLEKACAGHGARVAFKMRLADIFPLQGSGVSPEEYSFALKSHFDFLAYDSRHRPLFAVEIDGASHRSQIQQNRDSKKNSLCERFDLPLLRLTSGHLKKRFRRLDLLRYFVDIWFLREDFFAAQENGCVPMDEIFWPSSILTWPGIPGIFPFDLAYSERSEIAESQRSRGQVDQVPFSMVTEDPDGWYHCLSWVPVGWNEHLVSRPKIRGQHFPIDHYSFVEDLATSALSAQIEKPRNRWETYADASVESMIRTFLATHASCSGHLPPLIGAIAMSQSLRSPIPLHEVSLSRDIRFVPPQGAELWKPPDINDRSLDQQ